MPQGTKHRKRGTSSVFRRGEAIERARRTGLQIVSGRAVVSSRGTVSLTVGGQPVRVSSRVAANLRTAALDPKNGRGSLYVAVDAPPPARLVRVPRTEVAKIRAANRRRDDRA